MCLLKKSMIIKDWKASKHITRGKFLWVKCIGNSSRGKKTNSKISNY